MPLTDFAFSSEVLTEIPPIPWDALDSAEHRSTLLKDPEPFSPFKSLDPCHMSATEMYDILNLITNAQKEEHYLLEFNVKDGIVKNLISSYRDTADLDDIVEVADSSPTTSKTSVENNRAKPRKNTIIDSDDQDSISDSNVPDFSPPLKTNPNKVSGTFSPVRVVAIPTFPTTGEQVEPLPSQVYTPTPTQTPSHNSSMLLDLPKVTAVPRSPSDFQSGQKRPRIDSGESESEQCDPKEPSDQAHKRVRFNRLAEKPDTATVTSRIPATGTPVGSITKSKGAKRGQKSKAAAKPLLPPPPTRASKR